MSYMSTVQDLSNPGSDWGGLVMRLLLVCPPGTLFSHAVGEMAWFTPWLYMLLWVIQSWRCKITVVAVMIILPLMGNFVDGNCIICRNILTLFVITFEKSDDFLAFSCLQALSLGHSQYAHVKHFLQMMHPDLCQTTSNYSSFNSLLVLLTGQIGLPMFPLHLLWDYIYLSLYGKNTD